MSKQVDAAPEEDAQGYSDMEGKGVCQWEDLHGEEEMVWPVQM